MTLEPSSDNVRALARGLKIIEAFNGAREGLTLAEVARRTDLSRGTARRLLLTLAELGYAANDGRVFALTPRLLTLCYAYLSSVVLPDIMMPHMESLLEGTEHVSSSAAVLDGSEVVFVCGVPAKGFVRTSMTVGLALPATGTSMGRVLLSQLGDDDLDALLTKATYRAMTPHTIVDPVKVRRKIEEARVNGYCISDREVDITTRSIAVPVFDRNGICTAAVSVSTHNLDYKLPSFVKEFLPRLRKAAEGVSRDTPISPMRSRLVRL